MPLPTAPTDSSTADAFHISPLTDPTFEDFTGIFTTAALSLGRQTQDVFWTAFNPGWETDEGIPRGAEMLQRRFNAFAAASSASHSGESYVLYVVATAPRPSSGDGDGNGGGNKGSQGSEIVGVARFLQLSLDAEHGIVPSLTEEAARKALNVEACAPGDPARQEYLMKLYLGSSLQRAELLKETMEAYERGELKGGSPPAVLGLDLCCVRPAGQGQGVGKALVQWGMEQARQRGGLESITEASVMGRRVYAKCGYRDVKESVIDMGNGEVVRPGVMIMRTGNGRGGSDEAEQR